MQPKPRHLAADYAATFQHPSVIAVYDRRPPYPREVFDVLASLIVDQPRFVLDAGCGPVNLARGLIATTSVARIDAVDASAGMIEKGKSLPGGDHASLRWICSPFEHAPLSPPYALISAGDSLHWFDWQIVLPRFQAMLTRGGMVAIVGRSWNGPPALWERLLPIVQRFSTNRDFQPYNLVEELERRGLFTRLGERRCAPAPWRPTEDEYIAARFSHQACSRDALQSHAEPFAAALRDALREARRAGEITYQRGRFDLLVEASVTWGKPQNPIGR